MCALGVCKSRCAHHTTRPAVTALTRCLCRVRVVCVAEDKAGDGEHASMASTPTAKGAMIEPQPADGAVSPIGELMSVVQNAISPDGDSASAWRALTPEEAAEQMTRQQSLLTTVVEAAKANGAPGNFKPLFTCVPVPGQAVGKRVGASLHDCPFEVVPVVVMLSSGCTSMQLSCRHVVMFCRS